MHYIVLDLLDLATCVIKVIYHLTLVFTSLKSYKKLTIIFYLTIVRKKSQCHSEFVKKKKKKRVKVCVLIAKTAIKDSFYSQSNCF